jgi:hypothetical protein
MTADAAEAFNSARRENLISFLPEVSLLVRSNRLLQRPEVLAISAFRQGGEYRFWRSEALTASAPDCPDAAATYEEFGLTI